MTTNLRMELENLMEQRSKINDLIYKQEKRIVLDKIKQRIMEIGGIEVRPGDNLFVTQEFHDEKVSTNTSDIILVHYQPNTIITVISIFWDDRYSNDIIVEISNETGMTLCKYNVAQRMYLDYLGHHKMETT